MAAQSASADAEEATATALARLPAPWTALRDPVWPEDAHANIDHIVVGPAGVFVIDTRSWSGRVALEHGRLWQNGQDRSDALASAAEAAVSVSGFVSSVRFDHVHAVVCCAERDIPAAWVDGVLVCSSEKLVDELHLVRRRAAGRGRQGGRGRHRASAPGRRPAAPETAAPEAVTPRPGRPGSRRTPAAAVQGFGPRHARWRRGCPVGRPALARHWGAGPLRRAGRVRAARREGALRGEPTEAAAREEASEPAAGPGQHSIAEGGQGCRCLTTSRARGPPAPPPSGCGCRSCRSTRRGSCAPCWETGGGERRWSRWWSRPRPPAAPRVRAG